MTELERYEAIERGVSELIRKTEGMSPIRAGYYVCELLAMVPKDMADDIKEEYAIRQGE